MNVISRKRLEEFWHRRLASKAPLKSWYNACRKARRENLDDEQEIYSHADLVGDCTVFNIGGIDTLHLNARRVIGGDSRFARFPNGNHPRSACPALSNI
jgi:mRNA-degrading endonuclease HigB of HigAB toxin-antitoxin module